MNLDNEPRLRFFSLKNHENEPLDYSSDEIENGVPDSVAKSGTYEEVMGYLNDLDDHAKPFFFLSKDELGNYHLGRSRNSDRKGTGGSAPSPTPEPIGIINGPSEPDEPDIIQVEPTEEEEKAIGFAQRLLDKLLAPARGVVGGIINKARSLSLFFKQSEINQEIDKGSVYNSPPKIKEQRRMEEALLQIGNLFKW